MKISTMFPSKYLKAEDLGDAGAEVDLIIRDLEIEDVGQKKEKTPVLYFKGKNKGFILNKTNAALLTKQYGDDTDDWLSEPVTLYVKEVEFQGDMVLALRVKFPKREVVKEHPAKAIGEARQASRVEPPARAKAPVRTLDDELDDGVPF